MLLLRDVIKRIFRIYGFDVISGGEKEEWNLLATKDNFNIIIGYNANEVKKSDLVRFLSLSGELKAEKSIYISPNSFDFESKNFAEEMGIIIWEREKLEEQIGRTILMECGTKYSKGVFEDIFSYSVKRGEVEIPKEMQFTEEEKVLKQKIKKRDAERIAEKILHPHSFLELFPYYVFEYKVEVLIEGKLDVNKLEGVIAVNGITKEVEEWEEDEGSFQFELSPIKHKAKIDVKKANLILRAFIVKTNTKEITVKSEKHGIVMYEKKKIEPNTETIEINFRGLFYLPIWHVEGINGLMKINAVNGNIVKEEVR